MQKRVGVGLEGVTARPTKKKGTKARGTVFVGVVGIANVEAFRATGTDKVQVFAPWNTGHIILKPEYKEMVEDRLHSLFSQAIDTIEQAGVGTEAPDASSWSVDDDELIEKVEGEAADGKATEKKEDEDD